MSQQRINPLRIILLLIGAASIVTNFILLVFLLAGSHSVANYMMGVAGVSFLCVVGAEIYDMRKTK